MPPESYAISLNCRTCGNEGSAILFDRERPLVPARTEVQVIRGAFASVDVADRKAPAMMFLCLRCSTSVLRKIVAT